MALKKRIIPIVLLDGFSVVKTIQFNERRNLGSPITVARTYNSRNVDELILLDIDATSSGQSIDLHTIKDIAKQCFMPLTVGGGIRSINDIEATLLAGADKVCINTAAITSPKLITEAAQIFGSQSLVGSIDISESAGGWNVYSQKKILKIDALSWAQELEDSGAGEILINIVERDGMMEGPNIELAATIADAVRVPVIYAGGVSCTDDCVHLGRTTISGLGVSSIFHFTSLTPLDCKQSMFEAGIDVRLF